MRTKKDIQERIKDNNEMLEFWQNRIKDMPTADEGYKQHCQEQIIKHKAGIDTLKWVIAKYKL